MAKILFCFSRTRPFARYKVVEYHKHCNPPNDLKYEREHLTVKDSLYIVLLYSPGPKIINLFHFATRRIQYIAKFIFSIGYLVKRQRRAKMIVKNSKFESSKLLYQFW